MRRGEARVLRSVSLSWKGFVLSTQDASEYHQRRERQERRLAEQSLSVEVRRIHAQLAERYAALIAETPVNPQA